MEGGERGGGEEDEKGSSWRKGPQIQDQRPGAAQSSMSDSIKRKNSSRQLLQNLIRVTAQRSQEDAEEAERERRRRARDRQRGEGSSARPEPPEEASLHGGAESEKELNPSRCLVLEEDEGFSDWSHRLENRGEQEAQEAQEVQEAQEAQEDRGARERRASAPPGREEEQREGWELEAAATRPPEKASSDRKERKTSYSSSVYLTQDTRTPADRTSYLAAGTIRPPGGASRVDGEAEQQPASQRQWRSPATRRSRRGEDDEESEELSFTPEEKEEEEQLRPHREEELEEELKEEEQKEQNKRSVAGRAARLEEADAEYAFSVCSGVEGEEPVNCYGPMSPTFKKLLIQFYPDEANSRVPADGKCTIIERTESLRRSTSNIKKTPPPGPISKIDKRLEQYTHALEVSSKEGRSGCQTATELMSPTEPVASKKNLFEAREAWNQSHLSPSKDSDVLKVGVADLINQWVRGSEDGSRCNSPFKPAESSSGKRYKFVVTGHGKYEKVSADDGCSENVICCQPDGQYYEDL